MILDALEANKWTLVLVGHGVETEVGIFYDHFAKMERERPEDLPCTVALHDAAAWRVALRMREGTTFVAATTEIVRDVAWHAEFKKDWRHKESYGGKAGGGE